MCPVRERRRRPHKGLRISRDRARCVTGGRARESRVSRASRPHLDRPIFIVLLIKSRSALRSRNGWTINTSQWVYARGRRERGVYGGPGGDGATGSSHGVRHGVVTRTWIRKALVPPVRRRAVRVARREWGDGDSGLSSPAWARTARRGLTSKSGVQEEARSRKTRASVVYGCRAEDVIPRRRRAGARDDEIGEAVAQWWLDGGNAAMSARFLIVDGQLDRRWTDGSVRGRRFMTWAAPLWRRSAKRSSGGASRSVILDGTLADGDGNRAARGDPGSRVVVGARVLLLSTRGRGGERTPRGFRPRRPIRRPNAPAQQNKPKLQTHCVSSFFSPHLVSFPPFSFFIPNPPPPTTTRAYLIARASELVRKRWKLGHPPTIGRFGRRRQHHLPGGADARAPGCGPIRCSAPRAGRTASGVAASSGGCDSSSTASCRDRRWNVIRKIRMDAGAARMPCHHPSRRSAIGDAEIARWTQARRLRAKGRRPAASSWCGWRPCCRNFGQRER